MKKAFLLILVLIFSFSSIAFSEEPKRKQHVTTKEWRDAQTPENIIEIFRKGNENFFKGEWHDWDFIYELKKTSSGQYPMAVVLSCIDSRVPAEIILR